MLLFKALMHISQAAGGSPVAMGRRLPQQMRHEVVVGYIVQYMYNMYTKGCQTVDVTKVFKISWYRAYCGLLRNACLRRRHQLLFMSCWSVYPEKCGVCSRIHVLSSDLLNVITVLIV